MFFCVCCNCSTSATQGDALNVVSDDTPGMKKGVQEYLSACKEGIALSCRIHVQDKFATTYRAMLNNKKNFPRMRSHLNYLQMHGDSRYKDLIWNGIKAKWENIGEAHTSKRFQEEHIDKNPNWRSGSAPYGTKHQNNQVELANRHAIKGPLQRALKNHGFRTALKTCRRSN